MDCGVYCTALSYDTKLIYDLFRGYNETEIIDDVIHVAYHQEAFQADLFFFPYGTFVAWNLPKKALDGIVVDIKPFETDPIEVIEHESYIYQYGGVASFDDEMITLSDETVNIKLAFSHGLANSAKLSAFEGIIQKTFEDNKHLPHRLAKHGKIPLSRYQIRRKMGQLFLDRTSINLHLGELDIPEFFWENSDYEPLYEKMSCELDLHPRTLALNQKLGVLHDLFEMLGQELSDQHSSRLEWAIILLIVLEVLILLLHDVIKVI
ncbi:MAG: RMD1 family protein [Chlamydiota bacterium]